MYYLENHIRQKKRFSPEEINVLTIIENFKKAHLLLLVRVETLNQRKVLRMNLMMSEDNQS